MINLTEHEQNVVNTRNLIEKQGRNISAWVLIHDGRYAGRVIAAHGRSATHVAAWIIGNGKTMSHAGATKAFNDDSVGAIMSRLDLSPIGYDVTLTRDWMHELRQLGYEIIRAI